MDATTITRDLLRSAKRLAHEEFDTPNTEAILAVFYRLCIEHDRALETSQDCGENDQQGWQH